MKDHNIISVSGGKDSTATLLLAVERETENLRAVFADTGHEHAETYAYLDYLEQKIGIPIERISADFTARIANKRKVVQTKWRKDGVSEALIEQALNYLVPTGIPFLDLCLWKGRFPSSKTRFCTEELKVFPVRDQIFAPLLADCDTGDVYSWQGIRAEESRARAMLPELDEVAVGLWNYRPILTWTAGQVFDFHRKHGVRWNPLYEQGMGRVGCMPCVNCRKDELREIAARFPDEIARVAEWERIVSAAAKRGSSTFFSTATDPTITVKDGITVEEHGIMRLVEWAQTARGGRQFDLLTAASESEKCSSAYGLCE